MYQILILDDARRDLADLDPLIAKRILGRLKWLAENFEDIKIEVLTGEYARFFKFRVGDYRALYKVLHDERLIVVYRVKHRRDVYR